MTCTDTKSNGHLRSGGNTPYKAELPTSASRQHNQDQRGAGTSPSPKRVRLSRVKAKQYPQMSPPGESPAAASRTPGGKVAAFFDLDKTIIATSSAHAYGREFFANGLISHGTALQLSLAKASFMFSGHSDEQMAATRQRLTAMISGWDVHKVRQITRDALHNVLTPTIYAEARELIESHKAAGHDVIIVSASAEELVQPIAAELGVDHIVATRLEVKDGHYTGDILFFCTGEAKAEAVRSLARTHSYDLAASFAYSDSLSDEPMLCQVGNPVCVNPDRGLKKLALERGWQVRSFKDPVPLFSAPSVRDIGIGTGVVAAITALSFGGWWLMKRTRHTPGNTTAS